MLRFCLTLFEMTISKNTIINVCEGVGIREPAYTAGGTVSQCNHYGKQYGGSSKN
jgi:hypothetical protein